jgi:hypothetical protein
VPTLSRGNETNTCQILDSLVKVKNQTIAQLR